MTAAVVRAATVVATAVSTVAVLVIVVIALDVGIIAEIVRKKRLDRCIARTADTAVEFDTRLRKRHLCATAFLGYILIITQIPAFFFMGLFVKILYTFQNIRLEKLIIVFLHR